MLIEEKGDEYSQTLMLGVFIDAVVLESNNLILTDALICISICQAILLIGIYLEHVMKCK